MKHSYKWITVALSMALISGKMQVCAQTVSQVIGPSGDGGANVLDAPAKVAVDQAGNVYVAGEASDNVFKISSNGSISVVLDASGDGTNGFESPTGGLAVDSNGSVFVTGRRG